jgi:hypothetical protein
MLVPISKLPQSLYVKANISDQIETRASLIRFEGQNAIGSADLFGGGKEQQQSSRWTTYSEQIPEMSDIKDSVVQVKITMILPFSRRYS